MTRPTIATSTNISVMPVISIDIHGETDDPATWQWTKTDKLFLDFVAEAHRQGFKIIHRRCLQSRGQGELSHFRMW